MKKYVGIIVIIAIFAILIVGTIVRRNLNDDIQIININEEVKDLSDKKYWLNDLSHPSSFAWEKITQIIKKKLLI